MFDIAGLHKPGRQPHSQFTDKKYAIYPQWLENIFKFTDLKCVNFINLYLHHGVGDNFGIY